MPVEIVIAAVTVWVAAVWVVAGIAMEWAATETTGGYPSLRPTTVRLRR